MYNRQGKHEQAEALFLEALEGPEQAVAPKHRTLEGLALAAEAMSEQPSAQTEARHKIARLCLHPDERPQAPFSCEQMVLEASINTSCKRRRTPLSEPQLRPANAPRPGPAAADVDVSILKHLLSFCCELHIRGRHMKLSLFRRT